MKKITMIAACGALLCMLIGCSTPQRFGAPVNPVDGQDLSLLKARVSTLETQMTDVKSATNTYAVGAANATVYTNAAAHGVDGTYTNTPTSTNVYVYADGVITNITITP